MNINDLQPGSFSVVSTPSPTPTLNINSLVPGSYSVVPKKKAVAGPPTPKKPEPNAVEKLDTAIGKPSFDVGQDKDTSAGGVAKSIGKSVVNTGKDVMANIWGALKMPFVAAKNIAVDIPKALTGSGTDPETGKPYSMGATAGTIGGKPVESTIPSNASTLFNAIPELPKAATQTILPPALQELTGVSNDTGGKPQPMKALQSLAEKPVSNILPIVALTTGIAEGKGGNPNGGMTTGMKPVDTLIEKTGGAVIDAAKAPAKGIVAAAGAVSDAYEGTGIKKSPAQIQAASDSSIKAGMQKGVKPTILGKQSVARQSAFYDSAKSAVKTISENRSQIQITNAETGEVTNKPQTVAEFSQALDQSKDIIYKKYSAMSKAAGESGATVDVKPIVGKLYNTAFTKIVSDGKGGIDLEKSVPNIKYSPAMRSYAIEMVKEVQELQGASPEIIESRIKDLNGSLAGYYEGRTVKAKAQIDASVAANLRSMLDDSITESLNKPGYQELKNQYGDLKALEKDVNKRAIVLARQNVKSLPQTLTDVWSGAELISGAFGNPAGIAKAVAGKGIMKIISKMNAPDTYIAKMFDDAYAAYPEPASPADFAPPSPASSSGAGPSATTPTSIFPRVPKPPQLP